ncbi:MAG TPA: SDR family NAD(P)-dependent oxidoreductase [Sandaracinaceae bacterium]
MTTKSSLEDTIAIVTGASRGAGRAIAIELGAAGATVIVTGRTTPRRGAALVRRAAARDGHGVVARYDRGHGRRGHAGGRTRRRAAL